MIHPETNEFIEWQIDLAEDMKVLLEAMRLEDAPAQNDAAFDFVVDENGLYVGSDDDEDWDDDFDEEEQLVDE